MEKFCDHVQTGAARVYQRVSFDGYDLYQCWKCAENVNAILGKFEDIVGRLGKAANLSNPRQWTVTNNAQSKE